MKKYDIIYLVVESPNAHGVFDQHTRTENLRYAEIQSVGMNETYQMLDHHLQAEYAFILANEEEYIADCKIVKYNDKYYNVTRTSVDGNGKFKMSCSSKMNGGG